MNDGGPDVEICQADGTLENSMRFTPAFWRKLYAGMAMQGLCACHIQSRIVAEVVGDAYAITDAMLAHRNAEKENDSETDN